MVDEQTERPCGLRTPKRCEADGPTLRWNCAQPTSDRGFACVIANQFGARDVFSSRTARRAGTTPCPRRDASDAGDDTASLHARSMAHICTVTCMRRSLPKPPSINLGRRGDSPSAISVRLATEWSDEPMARFARACSAWARATSGSSVDRR
jgi:hypothetical protein